MNEFSNREETELLGLAIEWQDIFTESKQQLLDSRWSEAQWTCFSRYIPYGANILEIGCGTGRIVVRACKLLNTWGVGLDYNRAMTFYSQDLSHYLGTDRYRSVRASGFQVPFPENLFDAVLSEGMIEHFSPEESLRLVHEHVRVCKPGGIVIISVPNLFNLPLTYAKKRMGKRYPAYPERSYTVGQLAHLMKQCGLDIQDRDGFAPSIGIEWYITDKIKFSWFDRLIAKSRFLSSIIGYECLVTGVKKDHVIT